jgi:threonine dehydratase
MTPPTLRDVYAARERLRGVLPPTPLMRHPLLCDELGADVWVKHENHLPTGAFKVRGGLNLVGAEIETLRGIPAITASTGNHGQSIAFACRRHGVACRVFVPDGNNPEKNAAMRAFGAEVVEHGRDFDEAREEVERLAAGGGVRYIHSANEPLLLAGVATYALEIFEELPQADVVVVPIGGGSGASGLVTVRDGLGLPAKVWGVQAEGADAFTRSWRTGTRVTATARAPSPKVSRRA